MPFLEVLLLQQNCCSYLVLCSHWNEKIQREISKIQMLDFVRMVIFFALIRAQRVIYNQSIWVDIIRFTLRFRFHSSTELMVN